MAVVDDLLGRFRRQGPVLLGTVEAELSAAVPRQIGLITWVLTAWSAVGGLCLVFLHDDASRLFAAGLSDHAGQRLLGVNLLSLAVVYGATAARPRVYAALGWLPLVSQIFIAIVIAYDVLAGNRSFGWSATQLLVSLLFAVLLIAFRLAGEPLLPEQRNQSRSLPAQPTPNTRIGDAPTERLAVEQPAATTQTPPGQAPPKKEPPSDDSVLGI